MFNKANPKTLTMVFVVLLVLTGVSYISGEKGQRSFKDELISAKRQDIDRIHISPRNREPFNLIRRDTLWKIKTGQGTFQASQQQINRTLDQLVKLKINQVVATSSDEWKQYKVTDSLATSVRVEANDETRGLRIGKLNFDPQSRSAVTYVRQTGDENVYGVNGFLKRSLDRRARVFRNKTLVELSPSQVQKIRFTRPDDSSFVLKREKEQWKVDATPADSAAVADYLRKISRLKGSRFSKEAPAMEGAPYQVNISAGKNIQVSAIQSGRGWIVHYSLLENSYFKDPEGNIRNKLFENRTHFLP